MVAAPFKRNQKIKKEMKRKKENKKKKKRNPSHMSKLLCRRKMWWDTQQVAGKKGLTGKETHPKKSCRGSKGPFHSYDKGKKFKIKNYKTHTHKKKNKQIKGKHKMQCTNILEIIQSL